METIFNPITFTPAEPSDNVIVLSTPIPITFGNNGKPTNILVSNGESNQNPTEATQKSVTSSTAKPKVGTSSDIPSNYFPPDINTETSSVLTTKVITPASTTPQDEILPATVPSVQVDNVISNVKKTISEIIKDALEGADDNTNTEDIVKSIVARVPSGIKIQSADINGEDLRTQLTEAVSTKLSEKAATNLRNRGNEQEKKARKEAEIEEELEDTEVANSISESGTQLKKQYRTDNEETERPEEEMAITLPNLSTTQKPTSTLPPSIVTITSAPVITTTTTTNKEQIKQETQSPTEDNYISDDTTTEVKLTKEETLTDLPSLFPNIIATDSREVVPNRELDLQKSPDSDETNETRLVLNLRPRTTTLDPLFLLVLTASPVDNNIESSEPDKTNNTSNIIQDGRIFADTSSSGVVRAKVVEDTNFLARSIGERATIGIAAIISIVIGVLAVLCFSLMVFLAMARRRRQMEHIGAPSSTGYASNSRYR